MEFQFNPPQRLSNWLQDIHTHCDQIEAQLDDDLGEERTIAVAFTKK